MDMANALVLHGRIEEVDMPELQWPDRPQPHAFRYDIPPEIADAILETRPRNEAVIRCELSYVEAAVIDDGLAPADPQVFVSIDTLVAGPTGDFLVKTETTSLFQTTEDYEADKTVDYAYSNNPNHRAGFTPPASFDEAVAQLFEREEPFTPHDARTLQKFANWLQVS